MHALLQGVHTILSEALLIRLLLKVISKISELILLLMDIEKISTSSNLC